MRLVGGGNAEISRLNQARTIRKSRHSLNVACHITNTHDSMRSNYGVIRDTSLINCPSIVLHMNLEMIDFDFYQSSLRHGARSLILLVR